MPSGPTMAPASESAAFNTPARNKQILLTEIGAKWGKFSLDDLSALKSNDDLVGQLVARYGVEKAHAQGDVDTFMHGRHI